MCTATEIARRGLGTARSGSWGCSHEFVGGCFVAPRRSLALAPWPLLQYSGAERTATFVSGLVKLRYSRAL